MKSCEHHTRKPCYEVIAEGLCTGKQCRLFGKVSNFIPRLKRFHELVARGVIPHTIWDFDKKSEEQQEKRKQAAQRWLELYPRIMSELAKLSV